jgi:multidrug resistance efflux pump
VAGQSRRGSGAKTEDEAKLAATALSYESEINGVNTSVANIEAQLQQAQYYLDNTTLRAPEDGRIVNLQVRPGMVSGVYRIGGIAALIADAGRYLLATYFQEILKYVRPGQPVEVAFDLYPGQIFAGKVDSIWKANGKGQYLPSDEIPKYEPAPPTIPQGQYAVKIVLDDPDPLKFPIGAQASAAIYTNGETGAWAALRKIAIRAHSWSNWLYPMPF